MIVQGMTDSFIKELTLGVHNFAASGGDTFKIALYDASASLGPSTTAYTATNEITGTGYVAGGASLTNVEPAVSDGVCYWSFSNVTWAASQLTASGALIYNSSQSNKAVAVLSFGSSKTMTDFTVQFPANTSAAAILRLAVATQTSQ